MRTNVRDWVMLTNIVEFRQRFATVSAFEE